MVRTVIAVFVAASLAGAPAWSQSTAPSSSSPAPDPHTEAEAAFARGLEATHRQAWSDALAAFEEAHRLYPTQSALFNIGYCRRALGEYVAALAAFDALLAHDVAGPAASRRAEAEQFARELRGRIAHLTLRLASGPARGTDVTVDGRPVPLDANGAAEITLDPGHHTLSARRDGFRPFYLDRDVPDAAQLDLPIALEPLPAHLRVTANVPRASVRINGHTAGVSPFDGDVDAGRLQLEVTARGFVSHRATLNLVPGATARVAAQLTVEPTPLYRRWWLWTGIGVVVTGAVLITYLATRPPRPYDCGSLAWCIQP